MDNLTKEGFEKVFRKIDSDETGDISQEKMINFILKMSGFSNLTTTSKKK